MAGKNALEASRESDAHLRAALESGNTGSVQIDPRTNKMRNQVVRVICGKGGSGQ